MELHPFLDALPYYEKWYQEQDRGEAMQLVEAEVVKSGGIRLPKPSPDDFTTPFKISERMQNAVQAAGRGEKLQSIDINRYINLQAPGNPGSLIQSAVALEYLRSREDNLELLRKHGESAWMNHIGSLEETLQNIEREIQTTRRETQACNRKRKHYQMEIGERLADHETQFSNLLLNSIQCRVAIALANH
ncbi:splicing factor Cwf7 [Schizosaccharomyces cryophilus OY26]|uniref:Splicing factor Cwf7 n=1 Tax=Schizosaccharomyces cryophilus (strain OY26 / ATCC MYA-4695 / CBS 11777 / NBRC 106824 / NRRL Y48691) TaxID=653667 RepID=S9VSR2_SCHCR|nr:splicing factor Cwf7 [Schizosaccharomyces cryophilus OY26]EPY49175.1 splicing factor Cwf7 [Schizosaccharomyces cryophilus OY26]